MLPTLTNLAKAFAAVAMAPAAAAADLLTLPSSAHDGRAPFARTEAMLKRAGECANAATNPDRTQP